DLGKRKSKPTQKLLDAGFLFSLYRPGNAILMSSSAIKRESTTPEVAPTKPVSRKSTKEEGCSRSGFSEIAGRTRRAVREARALPGFDGRLREAKGTRPQAKRSASIGRGEKCVELCASSWVSEPLRSTRSGQSKLLESLRRKRLRRLRAARRVPGNIAPVVSHTCPECSAFYKNCDTLIMHRIRHIEGKHWPCPLCNKSFFRQRNVQNHIRTHDQKLYKCRLCITYAHS
uniref:Si:dkey-229b18.3 n=1 Tax=Lepisosteus oculatus TaxID=7918 RepID=W5MIY0_LEPOC